MRRSLFIAVALFAGLMLAAAPGTAGTGQQKDTKPEAKGEAKGKAPKQERVDGTVETIDKAAHSLTVRARPDGVLRQVLFTDKTVVTILNKGASIDDVKAGLRVICVGQPNEKGLLVAARIDLRQK
jgi:hypothetical protein